MDILNEGIAFYYRNPDLKINGDVIRGSQRDGFTVVPVGIEVGIDSATVFSPIQIDAGCYFQHLGVEYLVATCEKIQSSENDYFEVFSNVST